MNQAILAVIKPDGVNKRIVGQVFSKFDDAGLEIIGIKLLKVSKSLAEEHYSHIKGKPFYRGAISLMTGTNYKKKEVIAIVVRGNDAIKRGRKICGATNPDEADPASIRGAFGRVTRGGVFENIMHVSDSVKSAKREIQLWFSPCELSAKIYPTKTTGQNSNKKRVWA